jgi:flagella basal body P-ring formation protein FlgA
MIRHAILFTAMIALLACGIATAAELRLKPQARCSTGVVRLGDVAEIHAAEGWQYEQLAAIELGPAPATGGRRYIRAREIQDALWTRGVNLALHQISGSERIEVVGPGEPVLTNSTAARVDDAGRERIRRQVAESIAACLERQTGERAPWEVGVQLTDEQLAAIAAGRRIFADGGAAPWTGRQRFTLTIEGAAAATQPLTVDAEVTVPPAVIAAVRNVTVGTILHESDLILKPVATLPAGSQPYYRIEDVVGLQAAQSIAAGAVLGKSSVRRPIVIRRGDAVTLYARSAGLRVRTTVRAREDGGLGDLVAVESLTTREPFYARVTGVQEAEVFAAPAAAAPQVPASEAALRESNHQGGIVR